MSAAVIRGWIGSSELCGVDNYGDDSNVYCPECGQVGCDSGTVAETATEDDPP